MKTPRKLEEKRDELATKLFLKNHSTMEEDFVEGFDEACNLLLPEIKKLEETLEWYGTKGEGAYSDAKLYLRAKSALKSLRDFLGSEVENE